MKSRYRVEWTDDSLAERVETFEGRGCYLKAIGLRDRLPNSFAAVVIREELRVRLVWVDTGFVEDLNPVNSRVAAAKARGR